MDPIETKRRERVVRYRELLRRQIAAELTPDEANELDGIIVALGVDSDPAAELIGERIQQAYSFHLKIMRDILSIESRVFSAEEREAIQAVIREQGRVVQKLAPKLRALQAEFDQAEQTLEDATFKLKKRQQENDRVPQQLNGIATMIPLLQDRVEVPKPAPKPAPANPTKQSEPAPAEVDQDEARRQLPQLSKEWGTEPVASYDERQT